MERAGVPNVFYTQHTLCFASLSLCPSLSWASYHTGGQGRSRCHPGGIRLCGPPSARNQGHSWIWLVPLSYGIPPLWCHGQVPGASDNLQLEGYTQTHTHTYTITHNTSHAFWAHCVLSSDYYNVTNLLPSINTTSVCSLLCDTVLAWCCLV